MSSIVPCTCSRSCQADSDCVRVPRFQAHLDVRCPRIHKSAAACADHLGTMVIALTTWAREQDLADAELTILAIGPPPRENHPRQAASAACVQTCGFVFSTIHLTRQDAVPEGVNTGKA